VVLAASYDQLKHRLTRKFGSADTASEALHEAYLRLENVADITMVQKPAEFLYRAAVNAALDGYRASARQQRLHTNFGVSQHEDDPLTPERVAMARSEIALLETALSEMPARRRAIFMAVLIEELPYRVIAERFGVSQRLIVNEVGRALDYARARLEKKFANCAVSAHEKRLIGKWIRTAAKRAQTDR
jgi:RNA polymerase sigma-70 factor (ECF subfamily)